LSTDNFELITSLILFASAALMLIALWRANQNRLLGACLLAMAVTTLIGVGIHLDRLRDGATIAVLNLLTAVLWFGAGLVSLRNRAP
jgi:hypothetical protein